MKEKLIQYLYEQTKDIVSSGMPVEHTQMILENYLKYLEEDYIDVEEYCPDLEKAKRIYGNKEKIMWSEMGSVEKCQALIPDKNLDELINHYTMAFNLAKSRMESDMQSLVALTKEDSMERQAQANELFENLLPFNIERSKYLLSETLTNYSYAAHLTDDMSLKIGELYRLKLK